MRNMTELSTSIPTVLKSLEGKEDGKKYTPDEKVVILRAAADFIQHIITMVCVGL